MQRSIEILQQQVAPVATEDAPMEEGLLQDVLRKFKKGCEEMTCEYFAAMTRLEDACALEVQEVDGLRSQLLTLRRNFLRV